MNIKKNILLKSYTSLRVGGSAEHFTEVASEDELSDAVQWAHRKECQVTILGGGSNVLISDKGVKGLVIKNRIQGVIFEENKNVVTVRVGAGVSFDELIRDCVVKNIWGLENLSGIPGSVGATPIQNVGAYGVEVGDIVESVRVYDKEKDSFRELQNDECKFSYRDSIFKHAQGKRYVVVGATYKLSKITNPQITYQDLERWFENKTPTIEGIRNAVIEIRSKKFPDMTKVGTAGSFFKNPIVSNIKFKELLARYPKLPGFEMGGGMIKIPLGWILDKLLHLKGVRQENVGTYEGQALVLVNYGATAAEEITEFAENIVDQVKNEVDIEIEWEVTRM